ncbi:MAG TPA: lipid II flippase MurJ [Anaerolineae bacterium]|nr:lipid II flippase MurJ [Anaerolineae bacterium]HOQ97227.1 lipid II flippase MurJ [Anaerolineae bacterium]HPL26452.1 lipid II flippase MurJ [Anaerolineae bacterium]
MGRRIVRDTLRVTLASAAAQVVIFVAAAYIAAVFGATWQTDAFNLAFTVPLFGANVVREAIKAVFVPVLVEIKVHRPGDIRAVVGSTLFAVAVVSCLAGLVLPAAASWALPLTAPGLTPQAARLTVTALWELAPVLPLMCLAGVLSGLLNSYQRFSLPMLVPGLEAALKAACVLLLASRLGIHSLALGNVLGAMASVAAMAVWARRQGLPLGFAPTLHPGLARMARLAAFPLCGNALLLLNPFVDRAVAARLAAGSITALNYAERINGLPYVLVGAGLFSVILSHWSQMVAEQGSEDLGRACREGLVTLVHALAPVAGVFFVLRYPLVRLALERGRFDAAASALTAVALGALALGILPSYVGLLLTRVYLVLQDTRTPMLLGMLNAGLNLALNLALVGPLGLKGIALSTTLTLTIVAAVSAWLVARRLQGVGWRSLASPLARSLLVGALCAAVVHLAYAGWQASVGDRMLSTLAAGLAVAGLAGGLAFVAGSLALRLLEPRRLLGWLRPHAAGGEAR